MIEKADKEINYRIAKWIVRNMEKDQLIGADEVETVWNGLIALYEPPTRCIEIVGSSMKDVSGTSLTTYSGTTVCGTCGELFGIRPWHGSRVWSCLESARTGHKCKNTHIHDYALRYFLRESMMALYMERSRAFKPLRELLGETVRDDQREKLLRSYMSGFPKMDIDVLTDGEPAFIVDQVIVYRENYMDILFANGQHHKQEIRPYSPKRGWWSLGTGVWKERTA